MVNFDAWMEDCINGHYGEELDRLDGEQEFNLQPPIEQTEEWHDEPDSLDDLDTNDSIEIEDDGQPSEYDEWQDFYGGDDWDHGQYEY